MYLYFQFSLREILKLHSRHISGLSLYGFQFSLREIPVDHCFEVAAKKFFFQFSLREIQKALVLPQKYEVIDFQFSLREILDVGVSGALPPKDLSILSS